MHQRLTKKEKAAERIGVMETGNHSKNRARKKRGMRRGNLLLFGILMLSFCGFANKAVGQIESWDIGDKWWYNCYGDDITATLNTNNGTLEISGNGNMADFYDTDWSVCFNYNVPNFRPPWWNQRLSIKTVIIYDGVTNIGDGAFDGCSNLTSIIIPNSVQIIGVKSFMDCTSLTNITLHNCLREIEGGAFYGCSNLTVNSRISNPPTITNTNSYLPYSNQYPFNGIAKLRVMPWLLNTYQSGTYVKEIYYDDALTTPTYAQQIKQGTIEGNFCYFAGNQYDHQVYKISVKKDVNYFFQSSIAWCDVYNNSGASINGSNNLYSFNYDGDAYVLLGRYIPTDFTLTYSCFLSTPTGVTATQNGSSVSISWTGVSAVTSYTLYRSNTDNGTYEAIKTGISGTNTTDTPPSSGTYYYKVEAHRSADPITKSDLSSYVSVNYTATTATLTVSPTTYNFTVTGGTSSTITVTSNQSWTVSDNASWLTTSKTSGSGNNTFTMTATANTSTSSRNATVTVSGGGITRTISVTQDGNVPDATLTVSPETYNFTAGGGTSSTITVTSNQSWTVSDNASWLTTSRTSGSGNNTFTMTATANSSTSSRNATVTVSGGGITRTISVTQDGNVPDATLSVSPTTYNFTATGGTSSAITVTSNQSWTVSDNASWLTTSRTSGSGNNTFTMTATANPSTSSRNATVTVSGGGITRTISVTQDGNVPDATLTVSPTTYNFTAGGGTSSAITVTSNQSWTVSDNASWLTTSRTSGSGNNTFTMTADANPFTSSRNATVTVSGGGITRTISVTQDGEVQENDFVEINGVSWATCNVDKPGTFVAKPEDAGMFYQWNRKIGWSVNDPMINSNGGTTWDSSTPTGTIWEKVNDPSPAGWRVPSLPEIHTLWDNDKVSYEWTTKNGVYGGKFTDKTTGNSIFLPAVGRRVTDGTRGLVGSYGFYWSRDYDDSDSNNACYMFFYSNGLFWNKDYRSEGLSVRCVKESSEVPTLSVSPTTYNFTAGGGTSSAITVTSNQSWTVSDNASWLTTSRTSGSGNNTFTMTAEANPSTSSRNSTVTVSGGGITRTISVTQDGNVQENDFVEINGVSWATRNVDKPGTFATNPEDAGMLYQWSRNVGWSSTDPMINSNGGTIWDDTWPTGATWEKSNDPCPAGWRVPTLNEIESLSNIEKVTNEWTTRNGINGRKFIDITTSESIFMSAVGYRSEYDNGEHLSAGLGGTYWSSTEHSYYYAFCLGFNEEQMAKTDYWTKAPAISCRCVKDNSTTNIDEVLAGQLQIFPNPAQNELFIKSDLPIKRVEIYSVTGNLLKLENNFIDKISVSNLLRGIYLIKVHTDNGITVSKFMKE